MQGPEPIRRIAQGVVVDPFGHIWLIGKILPFGRKRRARMLYKRPFSKSENIYHHPALSRTDFFTPTAVYNYNPRHHSILHKSRVDAAHVISQTLAIGCRV
jgi:hypothetical protein